LGELTQNHCLLLSQNARMQQLGEHALDTVWLFADIF
jgi:hypothetical protein